jgi:hypothetical protein
MADHAWAAATARQKNGDMPETEPSSATSIAYFWPRVGPGLPAMKAYLKLTVAD